MPVNLSCPDCGADLRLAAPPAEGKAVRCPRCGATFRPAPTNASAAAPSPAIADRPADTAGGEPPPWVVPVPEGRAPEPRRGGAWVWVVVALAVCLPLVIGGAIALGAAFAFYFM